MTYKDVGTALMAFHAIIIVHLIDKSRLLVNEPLNRSGVVVGSIFLLWLVLTGLTKIIMMFGGWKHLQTISFISVMTFGASQITGYWAGYGESDSNSQTFDAWLAFFWVLTMVISDIYTLVSTPPSKGKS
jgi:hypothetical protein